VIPHLEHWRQRLGRSRPTPLLGRDATRIVRDFPSLDKVASGSHIFMMRSVGLKVLKNKLAEYVRLAASGETVLVTDRDRVVAELSPPRVGRAESLMDAHLAELVRGGLISPPTRARGVPPGRRPVAATETLLAELRADRDSR
jgi:antitoxin (DNA-binding transcriptional repressor) of toxin-antitoxin stability system